MNTAPISAAYQEACIALQTDFRAKSNALNADYRRQRTLLVSRFWLPCNIQAADYDARKKEYRTEYNRICTEFNKSRLEIYVEDRKSRNALNAEYYSRDWVK